MKTNQQHNTIYRPYCYLIGWSKLNKFYYGVRFSKIKGTKSLYNTGCHPDDLWVTYFTSSETVKEYRLLYGEPDIIQIRKTFETSEAAQLWESKVLRLMLTGPSREKFLNARYGGVYVLTEERRRKLSEVRKGCGLGRRLTEETRRKISEAQKGRVRGPISEEHRRKLSESHKGHVPSEETRRKLSEAGKGKKRGPFSEEHRRKLSEAHKGRKLEPFSEEHRRKLSESHKGPSEETRRKISEAQQARVRGPVSEETRRKISEAQKGKKRGPLSEETKRKISESRKSSFSACAVQCSEV